MDTKTYWLEFISGTIDRLYQKDNLNIKKSSAYNDGIKHTMIKEIEEKLYQKIIDELIKQ
jgi:hypothetical protein